MLESRKIEKKSEHTHSYVWKNLECELCKSYLPAYLIDDDNKTHELLKIERPLKFYMVIESVTSNSSKAMHIVQMPPTVTLSVGRGHECDVRITDISVSRTHSYISCDDAGNYYVSDNDSKFGTMKLSSNPVKISCSKPMYF